MAELTQAGRRWIGRVVWLGWAALACYNLGFLWSYRGGVPCGDELWDIPAAIGDQPLTLDHLWAPANQHRSPVPRLVYVGVMRATGFDWRSVAVLNGMVLAVAAAALTAGAGRVRGRPAISDLAFSLLLLHQWGWDQYLWNAMLNHVLGNGLGLCLAAYWVGGRAWAGGATGVGLTTAAGVCLIGCGSVGVAYAAAVVGWLGWRAAAAAWAGRRGLAVTAGGGAAAVAGVIGLYFHGLPPTDSPPADPVAVVRTISQFLGMGFGRPAAQLTWDTPGLWSPVGLAVGAVLLVTGAFTLAGARGDIGRAAGVIAFLGGFAVLAAGIAVSRGGSGPAPGLAIRYSFLAAAGPCGLLLIWAASRAPVARVASLTLLVAAAGVWVPNAVAGRDVGRAQKRRWVGFDADVRAGVPAGFLANKFWHELTGHYENVPYVADRLTDLHRHGIRPMIAPFRPTPGREEVVPVEVVRQSGGRWDGRRFVGDGPGPEVVFRVNRPTVAGLRVRYEFTAGAPGPQAAVFAWQVRSREMRHSATTLAPGDGRETLVWVDGPLHELRLILPHNADITITELTILND